MSSQRSRISSSELTTIRKNRVLYANYVTQRQNVTSGCKISMGLESSSVAPSSIMPEIRMGALFTTVAERDSILANACQISTDSSTPNPPPSALLVFTNVETTSWTAPEGVFSVEYLVVGGGGGSGGGYDTGAGGGGGGGMVLTGTLSVIPGTVYTITVGDGGTAGISNRLVLPETDGGDGENSTFASITALGGGGGFGSRQPPAGNNGSGGTAASNPSTASTGGRGGGSNSGGGGGGGSSGDGGTKSGTIAGTAGTGTNSSLSGSLVTYGVGGAGGTGNNNNAGIAGSSNTGNGARGGGGTSGSDRNGAKGGSGIVVISY